jgi:hypothetical protein
MVKEAWKKFRVFLWDKISVMSRIVIAHERCGYLGNTSLHRGEEKKA